MADIEKWAANVAFVGNKDTVKKILDIINELEESGELQDCTGIDGPYDSLQDLLKRRVDNLLLESQADTEEKK